MNGILPLSAEQIDTHRRVQAIARSTLQYIATEIRPGRTERQLANLCRAYMDRRGATGYWWFDVPALVLAGPRLRDSMEGDVYQPGDTPVQPNDMVTVDLGPEIDGFWGDCARTFFLADGVVVSAHEAGAAQTEGMAAEATLHAHLLSVARPAMRFCDLHAQIHRRMAEMGFENLDFLGNFGHSIGRDLHARAYIDANCSMRLGDVPLFTLEPHIARPGSPLAFKYEEIYGFVAGELRLL